MASGPIISWQIDRETMETVTDFIFLGSKITADGDCCKGIKRCLLLRRKAMTNLDNILKSRHITLPAKVCIIKAMVFPVVMYRCKSRTRKKAKCQRTDAFELWSWEDCESPLDCKEIKPGNPKGNQSWIFIGRTDAEAEAPILWPPDAKSQLIGKDPDAEKNWGQKEKRVTENEMVEWHHWLNGHEFEQTPGDGEGQRGLACCSPWGHKEPDTTEQLNNNNPSDLGMVSGLCSLSLPRRASVCLDSSFLHSSKKIIYSHKTGILTVLAWWFFSLLRPSDLHCLLFEVWTQLPHIEDSDVHPMAVYRARWVGH